MMVYAFKAVSAGDAEERVLNRLSVIPGGLPLQFEALLPDGSIIQGVVNEDGAGPYVLTWPAPLPPLITDGAAGPEIFFYNTQ